MTLECISVQQLTRIVTPTVVLLTTLRSTILHSESRMAADVRTLAIAWLSQVFSLFASEAVGGHKLRSKKSVGNGKYFDLDTIQPPGA
jgi:hypothetical protein